jgi:hypothetical protein
VLVPPAITTLACAVVQSNLIKSLNSWHKTIHHYN